MASITHRTRKRLSPKGPRETLGADHRRPTTPPRLGRRRQRRLSREQRRQLARKAGLSRRQLKRTCRQFPEPIHTVFEPLAQAPTRPTHRRLVSLALAAILTVGGRTIANLLRGLGALAPGHPGSYHRALSHRRWPTRALARRTIAAVLARFAPRGPVALAGDDTVTEHPGDEVYGKGCHRDPVRSTHSSTAFRRGHKWVVSAVLVRFPSCRRRWALPLMVASYRPEQEGIDGASERAHKTPADLLAQVLRILIRWSPDRTFVGAADGDYAAHMCVFARQNVTADPPFSHLDLISCRNVLIYLASPLQRRVLPTFHYALKIPGFLVLGTAETVGENFDLFELADRPNKIYAKKAAPARPAYFASEGLQQSVASFTARRSSSSGPMPADFQREADRLMLGRYAPPGVLINEAFDILQFRGRTSPYLEVPSGEPTTNLLKLAKEGLFVDLRNAIKEAKQSGRSVGRRGVRIRSDGGSREIDLEVIPVKPGRMADGCLFVLFLEPAEEADESEPPASAAVPTTDRDELRQLRPELAATKEYIQSMIEQQDAANEELRSANEEILSSNEELQSTNEELETAKEELQSSNEELTTVNEQLQNRNLELTQSNNDFTNLLSSTNMPLVMVGADLRVRLLTASAKSVLNLLPTDVGRPIGEIKPAIEELDVVGLIRAVIQSNEPRDKEVCDLEGRWHSLRDYPYRKTDRKVSGAMVVLVDIDPHKRAEKVLRDADRRKDEFLATLAHELRSPLAPIRNAVEILRRVSAESEMAEQAREVLARQVNQMSRIVEDLIDVSRIVEKKVELRPRRLDLAGPINAAIETCRSYLESCGHEVVLSLPSEPLELDGDPERLTQVVINLLNNAAKFTEPGGKIWVDAKWDARAWIVVRVRDTGIGIPEVYARKRPASTITWSSRSNWPAWKRSWALCSAALQVPEFVAATFARAISSALMKHQERMPQLDPVSISQGMEIGDD